MKISVVRSQLNTFVNLVFREGTRVMVEKSGVPVAGLVSVGDLRRLDRLDRERAERFSVINEMRAAFKDVGAEEIDREAKRAIAEVRAEMREERDQAAAKP
jgi:hypothetical protein